ncbi:Bug family tripartite tricarboxylate transporter substrate binding protein [Comamonas antarctica]|uniref:Tripartite tricarboxylate transporter substrate binding protein n=1 Tax=Comamonas antarctica TaxID=2743470 RepID=A0A6N1X341_9BURK|nr:tripartite tricarboxylate transporter substrate binding protein [Comamonas antarctica]QKV52185.1 tripartite tricarboxylate transporter substrate binding protein [Comamonas antarctica]
MDSKRKVLKIMAAAGLLAVSGMALAQSGKPVRMLLPLAAGGSSDTIGRAVANEMSKTLGTTIVAENKPGASGTLALGEVIRTPVSNPTFGLVLGSTLAVVPHLMKVPYDSVKDVKPVVQLGITPFVLLVNKNHPAKNLAEFVAMSKRKPQTFGSYGAGTSSHVTGEAFNNAAGLKQVHVPYKGTAPAINDLLGSQVDSVVADFGVAGQHIGKDGKLRALAVTGPARSEGFPDVPTFGEQGYASMNDLVGWIAFVTSSATSDEQVASWAKAASNALRVPEVRQRLVSQGYVPAGTYGKEFDKIVADEPVRWGGLIKASNITLEN